MGAAGGLAVLHASRAASWAAPPAAPLAFGLTPVFLNNDLALLSSLQAYLEKKTGRRVRLVQRRTYQEITALLVSGQLDAAWICGYPFAAYREHLSLVAVPLWRGRPLYQAYFIAGADRDVSTIEECRGDVHAFSDPDSNSGYLVTAAYLAERHERPSSFFRRTFFTYGHRNVVRAVASGLARSGSVDGYVYEVMRETEPELTRRTKIVRRSEWLGFPPIAAARAKADAPGVRHVQRALIDMHREATGRQVLGMLRLDGFTLAEPRLFDAIAAKMALVRRLG